MNVQLLTRLRKAAKVTCKTLTFRNAVVADAVFIFSLPTNAKNSRLLSAVNNDLSAQVPWLLRYAQATNQAYFMIEHENEPIGTVRLYNPQGVSFLVGLLGSKELFALPSSDGVSVGSLRVFY